MKPDVPDGHVMLRAVFDQVSLTMLLDTEPPSLSGDFGGWESLPVPRKRAVRYWAANPEAKLALPVILLKGATTVTDQVKRLQSIGTGTATPGGGFRGPRQLEVFGQVPPLPLTRWVIDDVSWGDSLYTNNRLIRQHLVITLGEPPDLDAIDVDKGGRSKYRTKNGKRVKHPTAKLLADETLQEFAARTLGNPTRWSEIAKLQKPPIKDPRKPGRPRMLKLPRA
ncbi:unannotated protein [freshwater metagenome]|uniref:Unannotated protein n=1 Tax=freshwater metagenome TaxID=449393 RepID=A0A6J7FHV8_9ZZZZ|nr:hypothetical protein [Actinomycetota bacterium]